MSFKSLPAHVARVLLGLVFFVSGLNGFLHFAAMPPQPERAQAFVDALGATGYLTTLLFLTEAVTGALLLANRFVPLALTLLAPVMLNIVAFHAALTPPATLGLPLVLLGCQLFLAWSHRDAFAPLFAARRPAQRPVAEPPAPSAAAVGA
jgi:uncharacterized membrane protein YphA (DoxX/SURF4 family)